MVEFKKKDLRRLLKQWEKGKISKIGAERELGIENARGKKIARLWESTLGVDTRLTKTS